MTTTAYTLEQSDTVKALTNLFQRKRTGGKVRAIVFGALTGSSIGSGISSGLTGNFLLGGIFGGIAISGISQTKKYSEEQQQALLNNYANGTPIPKKIKSKLKAKDFR